VRAIDRVCEQCEHWIPSRVRPPAGVCAAITRSSKPDARGQVSGLYTQPGDTCSCFQERWPRVGEVGHRCYGLGGLE
jgi:hypothetical protein